MTHAVHMVDAGGRGKGTQRSDAPETQPSVGRAAWVFVDGKPGHESQSRGLAETLASLIELHVEFVPVISTGRAVGSLLTGLPATWRGLGRPDLAIGAGHQTHASLLAARRCFGCRTVVLMKPSFPLSWFDLCIIPRHDEPPRLPNVVPTWGAINRMRVSSAPRGERGALLIGGPSKHVEWNDQAVLIQVKTLLARDPAMHWTASPSRRTPDSFTEMLTDLDEPRLHVVPWAASPPGWVDAQLATCACAWVTEDSVSMVYEALSAGAAVGTLHVPARSENRVVRGLGELAAGGMVRRFTEWVKTDDRPDALPRPDESLNEAERCARLIVDRWFSRGGPA